MLKRTVKMRGFGLTSFIDVQGFDTGRQTDVYRPYPKFSRTAIQQACDMERQQTNELAKDYVAFHGGTDPLDENGHLVKGMATWKTLVGSSRTNSTADQSASRQLIRRVCTNKASHD